MISLALTAFAMFTTYDALADVISPTNNDTAFRFTLMRPESEYVPFQLFYKGKELKPNVPVHVDVIQKCLDLKIVIAEAQSQPTRYCTKFEKGKVADISIYGLNLKGQTAVPDGVYGDIPIRLQINNSRGTLLTVPSTMTTFSNAKLIPFFTDDTNNTSVTLFNSAVPLTIDNSTGVAEFTLPAEPLPPIAIKRMQTSVFPDFQPGQILITRTPRWSGAWTRDFPTEKVFNMPASTPIDIPIFLMPWPQSDTFLLAFTSGPNSIELPAFTTGTGDRPPQTRILPNYPTEINVYRIDIDDVSVTNIDGTTKQTKGTYTVTRRGPGPGEYPIAYRAPTKTGIDVITGSYKVAVDYVDPFTLTTEQKVYELKFK